MCVSDILQYQTWLYRMMESGMKTLIFPPTLHCYFVFSSGNLPVIPNMYTTSAEARNVLTETNRFNSVIICHEQECFTCRCYNSFACNSFRKAKHRRGLACEANTTWLEPQGWQLQGFFQKPTSLKLTVPSQALYPRCCSADLTGWWIDTIAPCY